ncbi:hypothetical protein [Streptomyces sp. NPDC005283]|uniref:hypothetical protein n=1 Tax=Streptomyces sp. NPDC005283 TaxID=3156871 RepID=UPI0034516AA2
MITLHELHQRGGDTATAVTVFGNLHPEAGSDSDQLPAPDWKTAERHFLELQVWLLREPDRKEADSRKERERLAEREATGILLAAGRFCPICRRRTQNA